MEDIFDVIDLSHVAVGHGGRDRLKVEASRKYANITTDMINIFLITPINVQHIREIDHCRTSV